MPIMSTRGSISVRFVNHLVPRPPATVSYRVADTPGDTGTSYSTTSVTTSSGSYTLVQNEQLYDICGTYTWICPDGVTNISVMGVGGGGGGANGSSTGAVIGAGGGGFTYVFSYTTTPGQSYTIGIGCGGGTSGGTGFAGRDGGATYFKYSSANVIVAAGGDGARIVNGSEPASVNAMGVPSVDGDYSRLALGGTSQLGNPFYNPGSGGGGGGGGGYGGGGNGQSGYSGEVTTEGYGISWGVGGGGAGARSISGHGSAGGGGVGLFGNGSAGTGGTGSSSAPFTAPIGGGGGSGGTPGFNGNTYLGGSGGDGGRYGGGGGSTVAPSGIAGKGASGALRIIWGASRAYPSTSTASLTTSVTIPLTPPRTYQVSQQAIFETPGRYTWIVPEGVTSISVMAVGGGGGGVSWDGSNAGVTGGAGAGYAYMYNYSVTPGTGYTIQVGAGGNTPERYSGQYWDSEDDGTLYDKAGSGASGGIASWFNDRATCRGGGGSDGRRGSWNGAYYIADLSWGGYWTLGAGLSGGGKAGGLSGDVATGPSGPPEFGGGGAAGTSNTKGGFDTTGIGYYANQSTSGGSTGGGGGGGGGFGRNLAPSQKRSAGGGGGIGIYGITATAPGSGAVGSDASSGVNSGGGGGGSGGQPGYPGEDITSQTGTATPSNGGKYGGGGGAGKQYGGRGSYGGHGVVRIIWGGSRAYPSTDTADSYSTVTF